MLNPIPVSPQGSPYSQQSQPSRPVQLPKNIAPPPKRRRPWKKYFFLTLLTVMVAGFTYAYAQYRALKGNVLLAHEGDASTILNYEPDSKQKLNAEEFRKAGDGRFNLVLVGIGGANHAGGNLTDSIQVLSIDTLNKSMTFTSVPRDLYVKIPGYGRAKINEAYQIGEQRRAGGGALMVKETVGSVLGIKITNFGLVDFQGAKDLVDALGGIEVDVPKAIDDPFYPADTGTGFKPFHVSAGLQKMNGDTVLRYVRSRYTTSDFDRSQRQQIVLEAIKKKALSLGTFSNPNKINQLVNAVGKHTKTDLQTSDLRALLAIYQNIPSEHTSGHVLNTSAELGLLTATTDPGAGYISYPARGYDDFSAIHQWFQKNSPDPLLAREAPTVTVANGGSATVKQIQELVETLRDYGYNANPSTSTARLSKRGTSNEVYAKDPSAKPFATNYLGSQFSTTVQKGTPLNSGSDFEIIYYPSYTRN
jgi:LCP family protein required for cell wall assembly